MEREDGEPLTSSQNVKKGDKLSVILSDGKLETRVEDIKAMPNVQALESNE